MSETDATRAASRRGTSGGQVSARLQDTDERIRQVGATDAETRPRLQDKMRRWEAQAQ